MGKAQTLNPATRAATLYRIIVTDYFTKPEATLEQLNRLTRPDRVYIMCYNIEQFVLLFKI